MGGGGKEGEARGGEREGGMGLGSGGIERKSKERGGWRRKEEKGRDRACVGQNWRGLGSRVWKRGTGHDCKVLDRWTMLCLGLARMEATCNFSALQMNGR